MKYFKILAFVFCFVFNFLSAVQAQDINAWKKSIDSQMTKEKTENDKKNEQEIKRVESEINSLINRLNQQYQSKVANSQTIYVLQFHTIYRGTMEVFLPDASSLQREKEELKRQIGNYKITHYDAFGTLKIDYIPIQYRDKCFTSTQRKNPNYNPNASASTSTNNNNHSVINDNIDDYFDILVQDNSTQIQGSVFAALGARERKQEPLAHIENQAPKTDLSSLDKYLNEQPKSLSDADIAKIIESCIHSSDFCRCVQAKFTERTGKSLSGKYSQMKSEADVANNREFNEYLRNVSKGIDARAEAEKKIIDDKFKVENAERYRYLEMAEMTSFVYRDDDNKTLPANWIPANNLSIQTQKMLEDFNFDANFEDGFFAEIYLNTKTNEYVVAFRGSEKPREDWRDWATNIHQAMGRDTFNSQYQKSIRLVESLRATCGKNCSISLAGHSLGGGLASAAGLVSGLPTYTFNAAGVHKNTIPEKHRNNSQENIHAYYSNDDILNQLQDNRIAENHPIKNALATPVTMATTLMTPTELINKLDLPPALGEKRINLGDTGCGGTICGHFIAPVINLIETPLKQGIAVLEKEKGQIGILTENLKMALSSCYASE